MIGRGCYGRPWFPAAGRTLPADRRAAAGAVAGSPEGHPVGPLRSDAHQFGTGPGVRLARKHLSWYSRGLPGSAEFRATMNRLADAAAVLRLIDRFLRSADRPWRQPRDGIAPSRPAAPVDDRYAGHDASGMSTVVARAVRLLAGRNRRADATAILGALPVPVMLLDHGKSLPPRQSGGGTVSWDFRGRPGTVAAG